MLNSCHSIVGLVKYEQCERHLLQVLWRFLVDSILLIIGFTLGKYCTVTINFFKGEQKTLFSYSNYKLHVRCIPLHLQDHTFKPLYSCSHFGCCRRNLTFQLHLVWMSILEEEGIVNWNWIRQRPDVWMFIELGIGIENQHSGIHHN